MHLYKIKIKYFKCQEIKEQAIKRRNINKEFASNYGKKLIKKQKKKKNYKQHK